MEDAQKWTCSEYDLDGDEDLEHESDVHGEGSTVHDTVADTESHDCNFEH